jgi:chemotaxis signal transduction protein
LRLQGGATAADDQEVSLDTGLAAEPADPVDPVYPVFAAYPVHAEPLPGVSTGAAAGAVLLRMGSSRYAVEMTDVAEVTMLPGVTRIPGSGPWLLGVANWRGRMLPVLDLRSLLDAALAPLASSARLVVVARDDLVVGLVAEAVPGVYDEPLDDVAPPPPTLSPEAARLVTGQVSDARGPVAVLDVAAVLALRDRVDRRRHGA